MRPHCKIKYEKLPGGVVREMAKEVKCDDLSVTLRTHVRSWVPRLTRGPSGERCLLSSLMTSVPGAHVKVKVKTDSMKLI